MASPFVSIAHPDKSHDITVSSHRGRFGNPLPKRYASRIAVLSGVHGVYYNDYDIFSCGGSGFSVTLNAWGGPGVTEVLRNEGFSDTQVQAFQNDPLAILTDSTTATRCGWHIGSGISPRDMMGKQLQLHVVGIIDEKDSAGSAVAHYAYINRVSGITKRDQVTTIYVHADDPRENAALAAKIQTLFAADDPPVDANPDTVNQNAWARFGKVQYLLAFVMLAVLACCALVLTSVMAHTATQRRAQMALLQVLGFPRTLYWFASVLEVALILTVGTILGYGLGQSAIHILQRMLGSIFQNIAAPSWTGIWLWPGLGLLLLVTMIVPSVIIARVRPVDCRDVGT